VSGEVSIGRKEGKGRREGKGRFMLAGCGKQTAAQRRGMFG
jgi:hypothetical protein